MITGNKILFVHGNSSNIGGQEIALLNSVKGLRSYGIESKIVLPEDGRFSQLLRDNAIQTFHIKLNRLDKFRLLPYLKTIFCLYKLIKKEKFLIINCSGAYPVQYCLPAAKLAKVSCVPHIHTTIYSQWDIQRSFVPKADYIIAVSDAVRNMLINHGCSAFKTKTVYCGVIDKSISRDSNKINEIRRLYGIHSDCKIVGQISLISPCKGLEYFIEMAAKVKKNYSNIKFMIIGNAASGYEYYETELKNMVNKLDLTDDIIFTGFQKELNKFISALDVIVLSSLIEGLPFSIVESLALSKPVVATSVGGTPEVIIDNQTGLLVPPKNADALAEAVIDLLTNPEKAKRLGENGKKLVLAKFSIENHAKSLFKIYSSLLAKKYTEKRILFYEASSGYGGSGNALSSMINDLDRSKFYPIVAYTNYGSQLDKIQCAEFIKIKPYKEPENMSSLGFLIFFIQHILSRAIKLYFIIRTKRISLVHVNTNIILGIPAILVAKFAGIPCVSHIRETRKLIKRELLFAKLINKIIVLNKEAYSNYNLNISKNRLSLIYDGLDLEEYRNFKSTCFREEYNLNSAPLIGNIGRIVEGKGQKEFVLVAKKILEKRQDIKFVIAGDAKAGSDAYFKKVKELAASNNLNESLIFTGWREDVKNILSALDIFVFTSTTYAEGLPNVIIEAMALAKPVVSTRIAGPADIVVDGKTGFLVPPGDIKAMADKIIYLLEHPDIAKRMGEEGRKRAEELFDIKKQVKKIEALYEELI